MMATQRYVPGTVATHEEHMIVSDMINLPGFGNRDDMTTFEESDSSLALPKGNMGT